MDFEGDGRDSDCVVDCGGGEGGDCGFMAGVAWSVVTRGSGGVEGRRTGEGGGGRGGRKEGQAKGNGDFLFQPTYLLSPRFTNPFIPSHPSHPTHQ